MIADTKETLNKPKCGNCLKPMLAVVLWFKIKKFRDKKRNVCAIYNRFFRVIKNSKGIYFYEFSDFSSMEFREFYRGKRIRFLNRYVIYTITFLFNTIGVPLLFLCYYPYAYFDGARNFIKDGAWYQNVRFFNWVNLILLIVFVSITLFKSYC